MKDHERKLLEDALKCAIEANEKIIFQRKIIAILSIAFALLVLIEVIL